MWKNDWKKFSINYDNDVFSVTKFKHNIDKILKEVKKWKVLNLWTWPTPYLNIELVKNNIVYASDWSNDMIITAKSLFEIDNLYYVSTDSRSLVFEDNFFDTVISINSILPELQSEVLQMFEQVYRVLKKEWKFIWIIPSYENNIYLNNEANAGIKIDEKELRCWDTTWWQCLQSEESLKRTLEKSGFTNYTIDRIYFDTNEEILEQGKLYWFDAYKYKRWEYFVIAYK